MMDKMKTANSKIDKLTIIAGGFSIPFSVTDRTSRQNIRIQKI